ncbi:DUF6660 family protein [Autumnicola edwardsiae]|uniref:DUF6660 family protein n=1 Tax=Autumnicola edwardsiae TaxID=3075594 RepID=UPI003D77A0CB
MKTVTLILSFFLLGMNVVPLACVEKIDGVSVYETHTAANNEADDSGSLELCPPFCSCQCCNLHTIDFEVTVFEPLVLDPKSVAFAHIKGIIKDVSFSLLQPPQA